MNSLFFLAIMSLTFPNLANAFSLSYREAGTFTNRSMSFRSSDFEKLVKDLGDEPQIYLHEFRDYSYPKPKLVADLFCDSLRKSTTPEQIAKVDQERVDFETNPHGGWPFLTRKTPVEEYRAKTPRYISALKVPSYINSQCAFRLTWSRDSPLVRLDWSHWNAMDRDAQERFHETRRRITEKIRVSLSVLSHESVAWTLETASGRAKEKP